MGDERILIGLGNNRITDGNISFAWWSVVLIMSVVVVVGGCE